MSRLIRAFAAPVPWAMSSHVDKYLVDRYFRRGSVAVPLHFTGVTGLRLTSAIWLLSRGSLLLPLSRVMLIIAAGVLSAQAMFFYLRALQIKEGSAAARRRHLHRLLGRLRANKTELLMALSGRKPRCIPAAPKTSIWPAVWCSATRWCWCRSARSRPLSRTPRLIPSAAPGFAAVTTFWRMGCPPIWNPPSSRKMPKS